MRRILYLLILIPFVAKAQKPPIDTARYLQKTNIIRNDTLATNLLTLNQSTNSANPMSGTTLRAYFQNGLQKQLTAGSGVSIINNVVSNTSMNQTVTLTDGNGISITGTYPNFTIAVVQPTITFPTRTLNSSYTVSSTKPAICIYTITASVTNPLLSGTSSATATLKYSTDGGSTWKTASSLSNSSAVSLSVTVQITNGQNGTIVGIVPANALTEIFTTTSGTGSLTYVSGEEIVY